MSECKLLPCGHCESAMVNDHCGKPEHRYCASCHEGECNSDLQATIDSVYKLKAEADRKLETVTRSIDAEAVAALVAEVERLKAAESVLVDQHEADHKEIVGLHEKVRSMDLQNSAYFDQIEWAWSIIASAGPEGCIGNWEKMDPKWKSAAEAWRDKWHELLNARVAVNRVHDEVGTITPDQVKAADAVMQNPQEAPARPDYLCAARINEIRCDLVNAHVGLHCKFGQIAETTIWWLIGDSNKLVRAAKSHLAPRDAEKREGACIDCGKPVTSGNICLPCIRVRYPSKR